MRGNHTHGGLHQKTVAIGKQCDLRGALNMAKLLELILSATDIYTLIDNILVSSDKKKATLTP